MDVVDCGEVCLSCCETVQEALRRIDRQDMRMKTERQIVEFAEEILDSLQLNDFSDKQHGSVCRNATFSCIWTKISSLHFTNDRRRASPPNNNLSITNITVCRYSQHSSLPKSAHVTISVVLMSVSPTSKLIVRQLPKREMHEQQNPHDNTLHTSNRYDCATGPPLRYIYQYAILWCVWSSLQLRYSPTSQLHARTHTYTVPWNATIVTKLQIQTQR